MRPRSRHSERKAYQQTQSAVSDAKKVEREIESVSSRLEDLREQLNEAIAAYEQIASLKRVREFQNADSKTKAYRAKLDEFPVHIGSLNGTEASGA